MSFITDILKSNPVGAIVSKVIDGVTDNSESKRTATLELERLMTERDAAVEETLREGLRAKEGILRAELTQGDLFTKRARPTVVYAGLVMITYNYCIAPSIGLDRIDLPTEFWAGWSGIVATWSIGRSMEKSGRQGKAISKITGSSF